MEIIPNRVRPVDREEVAELYRKNRLRYRELVARFSVLRDEIARAPVGRTAVGQCRTHRPQGGQVPSAHPVMDTRTGELLALHRAYAVDRDDAQRQQLVSAYDDFARALARDFHTRRESLEDLIQVARLGLLQAIDRFDPGRERPFVVFARATIVGELKRHLRDRTWSMRVPRSLQEHYLVAVRTVDELTQELGRSPRIREVAERAGLSEDHVIEAIELGSAQRLASLDAPLADGRVPEPGAEDSAFDAAEGRAFVSHLLARLPEPEQRILELRFLEGLSQTEIGARLGVSQMYVSRMLSRTLSRLRVCAQIN